jgi:hypothetical protein
VAQENPLAQCVGGEFNKIVRLINECLTKLLFSSQLDFQLHSEAFGDLVECRGAARTTPSAQQSRQGRLRDTTSLGQLTNRQMFFSHLVADQIDEDMHSVGWGKAWHFDHSPILPGAFKNGK